MNSYPTCEFIVEREYEGNLFTGRWYWAVCVPENNWGVVKDGYKLSWEDANKEARYWVGLLRGSHDS